MPVNTETMNGGDKVSKKAALILSVVLFAALAALFVLEIKNPAGGAALLSSLF